MKIACLIPLLFLVACAPKDDGPEKDRNGNFIGQRASGDTILSELPSGSFLVLNRPMIIDMKKLSRYGAPGVAYYQRFGEQAYGPGSEGWTKKTPPYVDPAFDTCTIHLSGSSLIDRDIAQSTTLEIKMTKQLAIRVGEPVERNGKSYVALAIYDSQGINYIECNEMTVGTMTRNIFGGSFDIFVPREY